MKKNLPTAADDAKNEIAALVRNLLKTEQRLQELTVGEVDAVIHAGGHAYLLHKAQEKLRQGESAQRQLAETQMAILNALPAHIALVDAQGVIISVNESWRRFATANVLQGPEFGVGQNYLDVCSRALGTGADDAAAAAAGLRRVLRGEANEYTLEYPCHAPRQKRWFRLMVTPLREESRAGAVVMHVDITERKQAEARFRRLIDSNAQSVFFWNMRGGITDANDAFLNLVGYTRENLEAGRLRWADMTPPEHAEKDRHALEELAAKGFCATYEKELFRRDGARVPILIGSATFEDKRDEGVCFLVDLTERKRAESRFRRLVDSNVQCVVFWNAGGEIMEANDGFLNLVGYTREDLQAGRVNWKEITPPEYAEADRRALAEIAERGVCKTYEKEYIRKDGSRIPVLVGAAAFEDNPGEGVRFILDLTENKKIEQQFLRSQRMESIGTLAGGIAHDLNNILAPIMMSIHLLKDFADDPESRDILETIEVSARRGADIVRQVLSFARGLEGERIEIQPKDLIKDLEYIIKDTFPRDIRLRFSIPNSIWMILGDPTQMHQILLNLCVNARDAMPNGGSLTIAVENCALDEHYAAMNSQAKPGRHVLISVTDSGTGMPPELLGKIFEPFFTTKERGQGTGLGLSTVVAIVKSHDGFINVYSEPGKGTTFKIYLPALATASEGTGKLSQPVNLPRGNGEMILVIDDEASILTITKKTLQSFGYRVLTATDGADGVAVYLEHKTEIAGVLTDMMMPIMDGPATIHALMRINPKLKIVAASGLNAHGEVTKVTGMGIKYFLTKPYTAGTLLKTMRSILDKD